MRRSAGRSGRPQLELFGVPPLPPNPFHEKFRVLASQLPAHVRFGTSSWTYRGWKDIYRAVYPSEAAFLRDSLREYATFPLFRTVGLDRGYYAPPSEEDLCAYAEQLPQGFLTVSKVWNEITTPIFPDHPRYSERAGQENPSFLDPDLFIARVLSVYERSFSRFTGPFVFEMPPSPTPIDPRCLEISLVRFFRAVPRTFPYALEIRDPRLLTARHMDVLADLGVTHVFSFSSRMPKLRDQVRVPGAIQVRSSIVARVLLPPGASYEALLEAYLPFDKIVKVDMEMRTDVVDLAVRTAEAGSELHILVGNKAEGCAPLTVCALAEAIARATSRG